MPMLLVRNRLSLWLLLAVIALVFGCRDKQKEAATKIDPLFDALMPLVDRDTKQIRDRTIAE